MYQELTDLGLWLCGKGYIELGDKVLDKAHTSRERWEWIEDREQTIVDSSRILTWLFMPKPPKYAR